MHNMNRASSNGIQLGYHSVDEEEKVNVPDRH